MFDFYESDWFTITLEIIFLIFILYDIKRYVETKKREYLINILLTFGFFIWAIVPFYNKYFTWQDSDKAKLQAHCTQEHNSSVCECLDDKIFKEYDLKSFLTLQKSKDKELSEFLETSKKICTGEEEESWFF